MTVGIVGLGLIGGSLAKAFKFYTNHTVYAFDTDEVAIRRAVLVDAIDGTLTDENLRDCDFLFLALYPSAAVAYLREHAEAVKPGAIVLDCCGVKAGVCPPCFALAEAHGFHFVGGHPMAGSQFSGFKHARADMFENACMILVPKSGEDIALLERLKKAISPIGFRHVTITTAARHDEIIAYTSQLAHVVSNAYVKSPHAEVHKGFSAGSYRDLTRVAKLSETMWAELFLENSENLIAELDAITTALSEYREALADNDFERLRELLRDGRERKERIDEEWKELP